MSKRVHFPNLDGLRFLCFLSVFFFHSFATDLETVKQTQLYSFTKNFLFKNGNLGVNFFFVLSGFLITYLLLVEKEKFKKVHIPNFYVRRVLRIWPLFFFCVFFGFVIFPKIKLLLGQVPNETANPLFYVTFLNNIDLIKKGLPDASSLTILWSVAIEEQFYLLWPIIIGLLPFRKMPYGFLAIIAGTLIFRLYHANNDTVLEHHTFSCISDMAVGGFFGYLSHQWKSFVEHLAEASRWVWVFLYSAVIGIALFRQDIFHQNTFLLAMDRLVVSLIFSFVILEQNFARHSLFKMSRFRYITQLGTYTYGLYCLHMIGILIAAKGLSFLGLNKNVYQVIFLEGGVSLGVTLILALISYHLFEKRFLQLKEKFALVKTTNLQSHTPVAPPVVESAELKIAPVNPQVEPK